MRKKLIVIFTARYPYPQGEYFLESEIKYFANQDWAEVIVCPFIGKGEARQVPKGIQVYNNFSTLGFIFKSLLLAPKVLFTKFFYKELLLLKREKKLTVKNIVYVLEMSLKTLISKEILLEVVREHGDIDLVYTYWNNHQTYGACLLKKNNKVKCVVTRTHGYDLYEYVQKDNYLPLRRQFQKYQDKVFAIAKGGMNYYHKTYSYPLNNLDLSRLGVSLPVKKNPINKPNTLSLVSVSNVVSGKRVDRIIEAIKCFALNNYHISVNWAHIGDGPLLQDIELLAKKKLSEIGNVSYDFKGRLINTEVLAYYETNPVTFFINTSESEGVPVSIMEAMSYGIPAIAPNVGSINELVNDDNGLLLSENPTIEEIAKGIAELLSADLEVKKANAREQVETNYNKETNYTNFVLALKKLVFS